MDSKRRFLETFARLRQYVGDRRRAPRRGARFAARLTLSVTPLDDAQNFDSARRHSLSGVTRDLSARGLTLLLPAMRVGDRYLTDTSGYLALMVETPSGTVCMLAAPARFEHHPEGEAGHTFLLGVRIVKMSDGDRASYLSYLRTLAPRDRRAGERERAVVDPPTSSAAWPDVTPTYVAEAFEKFLRHKAHT